MTIHRVPLMHVIGPEEARSRREQTLDGIHANLEADEHPKEMVRIHLVADGRVIHFDLPSLKRRKIKTPSVRERRRLLGFQLADFLTAAGL